MRLKFRTWGGLRHLLIIHICNEANICFALSGQQYELLDWLDNVTFPMEANFADVEFARETYVEVVRRVINCGVCLSSGIRSRVKG